MDLHQKNNYTPAQQEQIHRGAVKALRLEYDELVKELPTLIEQFKHPRFTAMVNASKAVMLEELEIAEKLVSSKRLLNPQQRHSIQQSVRRYREALANINEGLAALQRLDSRNQAARSIHIGK